MKNFVFVLLRYLIACIGSQRLFSLEGLLQLVLIDDTP
ncbi:unknown protein [Simkania negevensis Z]|uniref:Uncharacterized protein n=1 Tax=Simkania negevensis (strain ATCC VR-1471 / DSM 27360 / Z) TaxID=331113 RepID=F8L430_SIMNZ|nr:unknown protein [Simkania negevensis Z]